jgi:hypothetical protein
MYAKFYNAAFLDFHDKLQKTASQKDQESIETVNKEYLERVSKEPDHWLKGIGVRDFRPYAQQEVEGGSSYLYGLALINLWGIAEAKVEDISLCMMATFPVILSNTQFSSLSGKLVEFSKLNKAQRVRYIFNSFKQKIEPKAKRGVGRFESILEAVDLGGGVHDDAKRLFLEMSEIRNNLVHQMGVADHKLVASCPWLKIKEGVRIGMTLSAVESYTACIKYYILEIDRRFRKYINEEQPPSMAEAQAFHLGRIRGQNTTVKRKRRKP